MLLHNNGSGTQFVEWQWQALVWLLLSQRKLPLKWGWVNIPGLLPRLPDVLS